MIGTVSLVGAGPGDPGLITVRGLTAIRSADAIVYDRLVSPELLSEARPDARLIYAGKACGSHAMPQAEINALLVELAGQGLRVVRLKGGDPFVFGRGAEEALCLAEAGVPYEVVPGVSSAIAAPAAAGIPVTCRQVATSFAVVTGHTASGEGVDWSRLATAVDTLVVLMGLGQLDAVAAALIANGRAPETPAALIRAGTTTAQQTVTGRLDQLGELARTHRLEPPVLAVVGNVVALRERLGWADEASAAAVAAEIAALA